MKICLFSLSPLSLVREIHMIQNSSTYSWPYVRPCVGMSIYLAACQILEPYNIYDIFVAALPPQSAAAMYYAHAYPLMDHP